MQRINLEQAAPGMILAKKVENEKGMTLCKEGTELTDAILYRLENAKISQVSVQGRPIQVEGEKPLSERVEELHHRFQKVASDPLMQQILGIYERQLRDRYGEGDLSCSEEDING